MCFSSCRSLASVTFEGGCVVSVLGKYAFYQSNLPTISIPPSVKVICRACFASSSLRSIRFARDCQVSRFESRAFSGSLLLEVDIPDSVKVIGKDCFSECHSLQSMAYDPPSWPHRNPLDFLTEGTRTCCIC
jgi:hypothetical protein